jgi:hypothetical protein
LGSWANGAEVQPIRHKEVIREHTVGKKRIPASQTVKKTFIMAASYPAALARRQ